MIGMNNDRITGFICGIGVGVAAVALSFQLARSQCPKPFSEETMGYIGCKNGQPIVSNFYLDGFSAELEGVLNTEAIKCKQTADR